MNEEHHPFSAWAYPDGVEWLQAYTVDYTPVASHVEGLAETGEK